MEKFNQEWFYKNLITGRKPSVDRFNHDMHKDFDIMISVDSVYDNNLEFNAIMAGVRYYWFPMNECSSDMGINSIFAAMNVLFHAEKNDLRVYLHCAVGANRSPTVKECYHFMRKNEHQKGKLVKSDIRIQKMFIGHEHETTYWRPNPLLRNIDDGFLPAKNKIERFLQTLNTQLIEDKVCLEALKQKSMIS